MACVKPNVQDLLLCSEGDGSIVGLGQYMSWISTNDLTAEPAVAALTESTTNEEFATGIGTFTVATGKKWSRFQMLPETADLSIASAGTVGQLTPNSTFMKRIPNSKGALGALKKIINNPGVIGVTNGNEELTVVGSISFPAYVTGFATKQNKTESYIEITIAAGPKFPYYSDAAISYVAAV
jgi:hypothetical protein